MRVKIKSLKVAGERWFGYWGNLRVQSASKYARTLARARTSQVAVGLSGNVLICSECAAHGAVPLQHVNWIGGEGVILIPGVEDIKPHSPISFNSSGT